MEQPLTPSFDVADIIKEEGGEAFKLCYQCGTCTATCPWNTVRNFPPRQMIHRAQLGLSEFETEDMWLCVTCNTCVQRCPRGVEIIDVMRALRRSISGLGIAEVPEALRAALKNISGLGNPQGEEGGKRHNWAADMGIKKFTESTEYLYFSCCYPSYDTKLQRSAKATVNVLSKAGVDFGILDGSEQCCGESVRKTGDESLFSRLAKNNISVFNENKVLKIITTSPHCFHTFIKDYPEMEGKYEVVHFAQLANQLIKEGKLTFNKDIQKTVTYHDPCYLGRHNGIYDDPREVLQSIPGLTLKEMEMNRDYALCCGGGGGRIWLDTKKDERFSDIRIAQALKTGASVMAVACPYCMSNFDDSLLTTGKENEMEIHDIAELLEQAM